MSRNWRRVSRTIQKLAAGRHAVKSEGMFPYETHYVLATEEEVERLYQRGTVSTCAATRTLPAASAQLRAHA
jgi:hypothetical protein